MPSIPDVEADAYKQMDSTSFWESTWSRRPLFIAFVFLAILLAAGRQLAAHMLLVGREPLVLEVSSKDQSRDRVYSLPGLSGPMTEVIYAGYANVNQSAGSHLYYYFAQSSRVKAGEAIEAVPLVVWFNGGPGASSMVGTFIEKIGPFELQADKSLKRNPYSWANLAHLISWDQPVGSGYSYSETGAFVTSMEQMAEQIGRGMLDFYQRHPEYSRSPVYLAGESFAGKIIPHFASWILDTNTAFNREVIPLRGLALGNPVMYPFTQVGSLFTLALDLGYATVESLRRANQSYERCRQLLRGPPADHQGWKEAYFACQDVEDHIYNEAVPFLYDARLTSNPLAGVLGEDAYTVHYFRSKAVRVALNVDVDSHHEFVNLDDTTPGNMVSDNLWRPQIEDLPEGMLPRLIKNYHVLVYAGNFDLTWCNHLGLERSFNNLQWEGAAAWRNATTCLWKQKGETLGVLRSVGNFTSLKMLNSGHLVPWSHPSTALDMLHRLLGGNWSDACSARGSPPH